MNLSPYFLEEHVRHQVEHLNHERSRTAYGFRRPRLGAQLRQRIGTALITAGERLGGIRAHEPATVEPQPASHSLSLGS